MRNLSLHHDSSSVATSISQRVISDTNRNLPMCSNAGLLLELGKFKLGLIGILIFRKLSDTLFHSILSIWLIYNCWLNVIKLFSLYSIIQDFQYVLPILWQIHNMISQCSCNEIIVSCKWIITNSKLFCSYAHTIKAATKFIIKYFPGIFWPYNHAKTRYLRLIPSSNTI